MPSTELREASKGKIVNGPDNRMIPGATELYQKRLRRILS